jgi:hypothetical protein
VEWANWESGDCVCAPDRPDSNLDQAEILRRVAAGFRRVVIDWPAGDQWVEARIVKAVAIGYSKLLLDAEHGLRGRSVLVSVADEPGPGAAWVRFYMTPDTGILELHYEPAHALPACRMLAGKLAAVLGYALTRWEDDDLAKPEKSGDRVEKGETLENIQHE